MRAWSQDHKSDGLIVIGVHTPEFSFEHDIEGARLPTCARAIDYPVAVDNGYAIWTGFANHCWPAFHLVNRDGSSRPPPRRGRYERS